MSKSQLEQLAKSFIRDIMLGDLTEAQAANQLAALVGTVVAVSRRGQEGDLLATYDVLAEIREGRVIWCDTCGWTPPEPHPRREGITRCSNCKEYRVRLDDTPYIPDCIRDHRCATVGEGPCNGMPRE